MIDIIGNRYRYFLISGLTITVGLVGMIISISRFGTPLRLGVDFTGGTLIELSLEQSVSTEGIREALSAHDLGAAKVQTTLNEQIVLIRTKELSENEQAILQAELTAKYGALTEVRFEQVGPTLDRQTLRGAAVALITAAAVIMGFITLRWRAVPNAFRYTLCSAASLLHDSLVSIGAFSVWGLLAGWEADSLLLTALLTIAGYSIYDSIVVFDRIRENISRRRGEPYNLILNRSAVETLQRSLATLLSAAFILLAILLLGGSSVRQLVIALLIGLVSSMYSSLFIAVPLLAVWEEGELGSFFRRLLGRAPISA